LKRRRRECAPSDGEFSLGSIEISRFQISGGGASGRPDAIGRRDDDADRPMAATSAAPGAAHDSGRAAATSCERDRSSAPLHHRSAGNRWGLSLADDARLSMLGRERLMRAVFFVVGCRAASGLIPTGNVEISFLIRTQSAASARERLRRPVAIAARRRARFRPPPIRVELLAHWRAGRDPARRTGLEDWQTGLPVV
jgi:hypothetical protein